MSVMADEETYSEEETEARREAALKLMLATPHKPHDEVSSPRSRQKRGRKGQGPAS
jgi:hypothetical protein